MIHPVGQSVICLFSYPVQILASPLSGRGKLCGCAAPLQVGDWGKQGPQQEQVAALMGKLAAEKEGDRRPSFVISTGDNFVSRAADSLHTRQ